MGKVCASTILWVYLRVGGGIPFVLVRSLAPKGLSPRGRRHHSLSLDILKCIGSISAWAEASDTDAPQKESVRVYLRVGGGIHKRAAKLIP